MKTALLILLLFTVVSAFAATDADTLDAEHLLDQALVAPMAALKKVSTGGAFLKLAEPHMSKAYVTFFRRQTNPKDLGTRIHVDFTDRRSFIMTVGNASVSVRFKISPETQMPMLVINAHEIEISGKIQPAEFFNRIQSALPNQTASWPASLILPAAEGADMYRPPTTFSDIALSFVSWEYSNNTCLILKGVDQLCHKGANFESLLPTLKRHTKTLLDQAGTDVAKNCPKAPPDPDVPDMGETALEVDTSHCLNSKLLETHGWIPDADVAQAWMLRTPIPPPSDAVQRAGNLIPSGTDGAATTVGPGK